MTAESPGGAGDRLLPWRRVQDIAGISRSTAWRLQQAGGFPAPVPVSPGRVAWWESELDAWKLSRLNRKPMKPPAGPRGRKPQPARSTVAATEPADHTPPKAAAVSDAPLRQPPSMPSGSDGKAASPKPRRPRARPVHPNQIDFGF